MQHNITAMLCNQPLFLPISHTIYFFFVSPSFSLYFFVLFMRVTDAYGLSRQPSFQLTLISLPFFHHSLKGFLNCNEVSVAKVRTVHTQHDGTSFMSCVLYPCYSVIDIPMSELRYSYQFYHLSIIHDILYATPPLSAHSFCHILKS